MLAWVGRILTLHLNYVARYTNDLLFLFERTHNYDVDTDVEPRADDMWVFGFGFFFWFLVCYAATQSTPGA